MPISGCHDLPLATFNLPSGNNLQNKPNSAATMSLPCGRFAREACSMPISGCHDLPLATFNLPSRNNLQNKPNSAATMSLP